jgi:transcriptional regulator with XRE-family HTH domain
MREPKSDIARRILEGAHDLNLSVSQVSIRAGKGKDGLTDIMDGTTANPRADTIRRIADALGVNVDWLAYGLGPKRGTSDQTEPDLSSPGQDPFEIARRRGVNPEILRQLSAILTVLPEGDEGLRMSLTLLTKLSETIKARLVDSKSRPTTTSGP